jgi:hypothetical protein
MIGGLYGDRDWKVRRSKRCANMRIADHYEAGASYFENSIAKGKQKHNSNWQNRNPI